MMRINYKPYNWTGRRPHAYNIYNDAPTINILYIIMYNNTIYIIRITRITITYCYYYYCYMSVSQYYNKRTRRASRLFNRAENESAA
jgi:hypothetical protein